MPGEARARTHPELSRSQKKQHEFQMIEARAEFKSSMRSSCLETSEASSGGSSSSSITQNIIDVVFPVRIFNKVCEARQLRALWGKPQHADASGPS